jgi:hypothetical protein
MASWAQFAEAAPDIAAVGRQLLNKFGLAYLGTVRSDGAPRVHPVCPVIAGGRLFVATASDSPKRLDLIRDGRYVLHMLPGKDDAEFVIRGRALRVNDGATRTLVIEAARQAIQPDGSPLNIKAEEWLFEYDIEEAMSAYWEDVGQPDTRAVRLRWRAFPPPP